MVEHPDDLATLIVHNGLFLFVPQHGHKEASFVVGVCFEVEFFKVFEAVKGVFLVRAVLTAEEPTIGSELCIRVDDLDYIFETFKGTDEIGSMGPGTA